MKSEHDRGRRPESVNRRRLFLGVGWSLLALALCLFLPAGTLAWPRGWLFVGVLVASSVVVTLYLRRVNPDVIAARVNRHEGTRPWDLVLVAFLLPTVLAIPVVAGLDDARFRWSRTPWWVCAVGYALLLAGTAGLTWAEAVNPFFEPTVRIQSERGHRVIDVGPYAIVRHPGYVAGSLWFIGIALALGSPCATIPAGVASLLLVLRTRWEDRMLQDELAGYKEYARQVRFKWVPGVW